MSGDSKGYGYAFFNAASTAESVCRNIDKLNVCGSELTVRIVQAQGQANTAAPKAPSASSGAGDAETKDGLAMARSVPSRILIVKNMVSKSEMQVWCRLSCTSDMCRRLKITRKSKRH